MWTHRGTAAPSLDTLDVKQARGAAADTSLTPVQYREKGGTTRRIFVGDREGSSGWSWAGRAMLPESRWRREQYGPTHWPGSTCIHEKMNKGGKKEKKSCPRTPAARLSVGTQRLLLPGSQPSDVTPAPLS